MKLINFVVLFVFLVGGIAIPSTVISKSSKDEHLIRHQPLRDIVLFLVGKNYDFKKIDFKSKFSPERLKVAGIPGLAWELKRSRRRLAGSKIISASSQTTTRTNLIEQSIVVKNPAGEYLRFVLWIDPKTNLLDGFHQFDIDPGLMTDSKKTLISNFKKKYKIFDVSFSQIKRGRCVTDNFGTDQPIPIVSTLNLFLYESILQRVNRGQLRLKDKIKVSKFSKYYQGVDLVKDSSNKSLSISSLIELAIGRRDYQASDTLLSMVGKDNLPVSITTPGGYFLDLSDYHLLEENPQAMLSFLKLKSVESKRSFLQKQSHKRSLVDGYIDQSLRKRADHRIGWFVKPSDICHSFARLLTNKSYKKHQNITRDTFHNYRRTLLEGEDIGYTAHLYDYNQWFGNFHWVVEKNKKLFYLSLNAATQDETYIDPTLMQSFARKIMKLYVDEQS